jgi:hypothetical protein
VVAVAPFLTIQSCFCLTIHPCFSRDDKRRKVVARETFHNRDAWRGEMPLRCRARRSNSISSASSGRSSSAAVQLPPLVAGGPSALEISPVSLRSSARTAGVADATDFLRGEVRMNPFSPPSGRNGTNDPSHASVPAALPVGHGLPNRTDQHPLRLEIIFMALNASPLRSAGSFATVAKRRRLKDRIVSGERKAERYCRASSGRFVSRSICVM